MKLKILAIGAHPDDIEFQCAGTLAKYSKAGAKIFMAHLCSGNMGGKRIQPEELAKIRKTEARAAAKIIGAESLGPIAGDLDLYTTKEMRVAVVDIIRYTKADIIITQNPTDYMPDHVNTSKLVFDAAFTATLPLYKTKLNAYEPIVPIYYMDTPSGIGFVPTDYVDITKYIKVKEKMALCHKSQFAWLKGHQDTSPVDMIYNSGKYRGRQCGVEYAEGFIRANIWGRVKSQEFLR